MTYRVKNVSKLPLSFEGLSLQPGESSEDLGLETYQRLLALYYPDTLVQSDETTDTSVPSEETQAVTSDVPVVEEKQEPQEVPPQPADEPAEKKRGRPKKVK